VRFTSAQLATAHKVAVIAQSANAFVGISDLLIGKCIAVLAKRLRTEDATLLPLWWDSSLTVAFQRLVPKQDSI